MIIKSFLPTIATASILVFTAWAVRPEYLGVRSRYACENYLQSKNCLTGHTDYFTSWAKTYHSRRRQEVKTESVQGGFEITNTIEYPGVKARTQITLRGGALLMHFDFLLAGIAQSEADPGIAIWLVPFATLLVICGAIALAPA